MYLLVKETKKRQLKVKINPVIEASTSVPATGHST